MKYLATLILCTSAVLAGCSNAVEQEEVRVVKEASITSSPASFALLKDGTVIGETPVTVPANPYETITLFKAGFDPLRLEVGAGSSLRMKLIPTNGALYNWIRDASVRFTWRNSSESLVMEPLGRALEEGDFVTIVHGWEADKPSIKFKVVEVTRRYVVLRTADTEAQVTYPVVLGK